MRSGDIRIQTDGHEDLPRALGVLDGTLHIYPVRRVDDLGDPEDYDYEAEQNPPYEIDLERVVFLQRLPNQELRSGLGHLTQSALEQYRLVYLADDSDDEGSSDAESSGGDEDEVDEQEEEEAAADDEEQEEDEQDEGESDGLLEVKILSFHLTPFEDSSAYFPSELRPLPPALRNLRQWFATHAPHVRYLDASYATPPPIEEKTHVTVIVNSTAGRGAAQDVWAGVEQVFQLAAGWDDWDGRIDAPSDGKEKDSWLSWTVVETKKAGDGERIGRKMVQRVLKADKDRPGVRPREAALVLGGDGTVHELLNGVLSIKHVQHYGYDSLQPFPLELVLMPLGTGNALYHHHVPPSNPLYPTNKPLSRLYSLLSFLSGASPAASAQLPPRPRHDGLNPVFTAVVSSAALHAAILHDAEAVRASHPGVERFKLAAQQNASRWVAGTLKLAGTVKRYSASSSAWIDQPEQVELGGEYAYLTAALTDRFEPTFVPAPFRSPISALNPLSTAEYADAGGSIDVVVIRPLRHKPTAELVAQGNGDEARERFVQRVWEVSGKMYEEGAHVDLVYPEEERAEEGEHGPEVVEVYRCDHFEWIPSSRADPKDRLVCLDGTLFDLGEAPGGSLKTKALNPEKTQIKVWA
ncbi:hypothetical protein JCM8097_003472 [Rhodosporidiobolus ruineniae]